MSSVDNERYSLDYDPEFEEMLNKFKSSKFHSSLIEDSESGDEDGTRISSNLLWSPSFSPINFQVSPEQTLSPGNKKESLIKAHRRSSGQKQIMQVDNVVIELSDEDSSDETFDSGAEDIESIDLNATYTAKTMGNRRLSKMLDVLKEIESDEMLEQGMRRMKIQNAKQLSKKYNKPQLPVPDYLSPFTPSPCTPSNRNKPKPQRSYRLIPVKESEYVNSPRSILNDNNKKRPHEKIVNSCNKLI